MQEKLNYWILENGPYKYRCKKCGNAMDGITVKYESGPHYAALRCSYSRCNQWLDFVSKPVDDPTKHKRASASKKLVKKFSRGFCELCLMKEDALPRNQTLEGHHVLEHQFGGQDESDNVWILCTSCHKLVHHQRRYHSCYYNAEVEP